MEIMVNMDCKYADMILKGYSPYDFRNQVLEEMNKYMNGYKQGVIKAYICDSEKRAVVGEAIIIDTFKVQYSDKNAKDTDFTSERYYCIKSLYLYWCKMKNLKPNMNEGWFKSKKFSSYMREIGFFSENDNLNFNYALMMVEPIKYEIEKSINIFIDIATGKPIVEPPENMCEVMLSTC